MNRTRETHRSIDCNSIELDAISKGGFLPLLLLTPSYNGFHQDAMLLSTYDLEHCVNLILIAMGVVSSSTQILTSSGVYSFPFSR